MKRMVVKIGSHTMADKSGNPDREYQAQLAGQIKALIDLGYQICLIISGSIYFGKKLLKEEGKLSEAAIKGINPVLASGLGWPRLFQEFSLALAGVGLHGIEFIWAIDRIRKADRHSEIRDILVTDLKKQPTLIPIIAERSHRGQTTDQLAGELALIISATDLVYLTSNDGIKRYKRPQRLMPFDLNSGTVISELRNTEITPILSELIDLDKQLNKQSPPSSCRNMITKLERANHIQAYGIDTWIVNGRQENVLLDIVEGKSISTHITSKFKSTKKAS